MTRYLTERISDMRVRVIASAVIISLMALMFTACDRNQVTTMDIDEPMTMEKVNESSANVVKAYIESIFTANREMFEKCYPEEFINGLKEDDMDIYQQYIDTMQAPGTFIGTQYINYNEMNEEGGYDDWESFRDDISLIQGVEASSIESLQIVCVKVYFEIDGENKAQEIYAIAYKTNGAWYMYELQKADAEFKN